LEKCKCSPSSYSITVKGAAGYPALWYYVFGCLLENSQLLVEQLLKTCPKISRTVFRSLKISSGVLDSVFIQMQS